MFRKISTWTGVLVLLGAAAASAQVVSRPPALDTGPQCLRPRPDVEPRRSLLVSERAVVEQAVSLEDVLETLARDSGIAGLSADALWTQWWDTQNPSPGLGLGANCDDQVDAHGNPAINDFPIQCGRNEGSEVGVDPFDPGLPSFYLPIGLVNRFDLAPPDGANCGEHRIIFARQSGSTNPFERNLIIFEAVLPNPSPGCGLDGCQQVAEFWEHMSSVPDADRRADLLRRFYLEGFPGRNIPPVIRVDRFSPGAGQIRTNQFMTGPDQQIWQLREFKLALLCTQPGGPCLLNFVPVSVKTNPFGEMFDENFADARTVPFQRSFVGQVENLAENDINAFFNVFAGQFNAGQSNSQGLENDYTAHFDPNTRFGRVLGQRLRQMGSSLRPDHLVRRSQAMSCAGCHELNNGVPANDLGGGVRWPSSLGFVHVSEAQTEIVDGTEHFAISPALSSVFLPHREQIFEQYLDDLPCEPCQSLGLESDSSAGFPSAAIIVPLDASGSAPVQLSSDEVEALDLERKQGLSSNTLGGPPRTH